MSRLRAWHLLPILVLATFLWCAFIWVLYVHRAVRVVRDTLSPDGNRDAMLMVINAGATDGYVTAVSIAPLYIPFGRQLTILKRQRDFVIDDNDGAVALVGAGQIPVDLQWNSNTDLTVQFPSKVRTIRQEGSNGPVSLHYRPK